jgi:hypothetical protein
MRRVVVSSVLALALAGTAAGFAPVGDNDGTLSVRNGAGRVTVKFTGSAVGRVGHGVIYANDPISGDGGGVDVWGCDRTGTKATAVVCSGDNIRFRADGGKYVLSVRGSAIFLSAVGRGVATLDGRGDVGDVHDGVYSLNDGAYRSLPNDEKQVTLVAPAAG